MVKKILLADDSSTIRKIVELTFNNTDIRVETVGTGQQALETFERLKPDLVLADVVMPEPSGYEICRCIKNSEHPVPVVLLAGTFEPFDEERARDCQADDHLIKPFEGEALLAKVHGLLAEPEPQAEPLEPATEQILPGDEAPEQDEVGVLQADAGSALSQPSPELVEAVARAVVGRLSEDAVREIARELVPDLATKIIRERIRELETGSS